MPTDDKIFGSTVNNTETVILITVSVFSVICGLLMLWLLWCFHVRSPAKGLTGYLLVVLNMTVWCLLSDASNILCANSGWRYFLSNDFFYFWGSIAWSYWSNVLSASVFCMAFFEVYIDIRKNYWTMFALMLMVVVPPVITHTFFEWHYVNNLNNSLKNQSNSFDDDYKLKNNRALRAFISILLIQVGINFILITASIAKMRFSEVNENSRVYLFTTRLFGYPMVQIICYLPYIVYAFKYWETLFQVVDDDSEMHALYTTNAFGSFAGTALLIVFVSVEEEARNIIFNQLYWIVGRTYMPPEPRSSSKFDINLSAYSTVVEEEDNKAIEPMGTVFPAAWTTASSKRSEKSIKNTAQLEVLLGELHTFSNTSEA